MTSPMVAPGRFASGSIEPSLEAGEPAHQRLPRGAHRTARALGAGVAATQQGAAEVLLEYAGERAASALSAEAEAVLSDESAPGLRLRALLVPAADARAVLDRLPEAFEHGRGARLRRASDPEGARRCRARLRSVVPERCSCPWLCRGSKAWSHGTGGRGNPRRRRRLWRGHRAHRDGEAPGRDSEFHGYDVSKLRPGASRVRNRAGGGHRQRLASTTRGRIPCPRRRRASDFVTAPSTVSTT